MSRRNLYLLHFNGRNDNLGDQFIFRALVDALAETGAVHIRQAIPSFVASSSPSTGALRFGVQSALATLRGGSVYNFYSPGGRTWTVSSGNGTSARASLRALKKKCVDAFAGQRIAIGTSVIPSAHHDWCKECDWIGVRDRESLDALHAAGIARAEYFPDLSFLPAPPTGANGQRHGVCVSFRKAIPEAPEPHMYESRLSEAFGAIARQLPGDSGRHVSAFYQVEEDEAFTHRLSQTHGIPFQSERVSLASFEPFYRSADIVVSNRLHCLLIGAYCGAVPVALTSRDHTKVTSLFETVGWEPLILSIEDPHGLPERFAAIQQDLSHHRRVVATSFDEQRRLGLRMLEQRFGGSTS